MPGTMEFAEQAPWGMWYISSSAVWTGKVVDAMGQACWPRAGQLLWLHRAAVMAKCRICVRIEVAMDL